MAARTQKTAVAAVGRTHQTARTALVSDTIQRRRERVQILGMEGQKATQIQRALMKEGFANPQTGRPYTLSTIKSDLRQREGVAELIGRVHAEDLTLWRSLNTSVTLDAYRSNYQWWDEFRNCKILEYQYAALFAEPINDIVSFYMLGSNPVFTLIEQKDLSDEDRYYTDQKLKLWTAGHKSQLQTMVSDRNGLGDQFVFVNPDASLTIPQPGSVEIHRSVEDPRRIVEVIVKNRYRVTGFDSPDIKTRKRVTKTIEVEDSYTDMLMTRIIRQDNQEATFIQYDNIFGFIPMVHFPNDRNDGELFGRPIYERLLPLFGEYNDVFVRGGQGVKLMGNPILALEGLDNVAATVDSVKSSLDSEWEDDELAEQSRDAVDITAGTMIAIPKGTADFKHPAIGFTNDWRAFLKLCFLLICDHTRIPEYLWGAAVEASKASTETQESPFISYIEGKRVELDGTQEVGDQPAFTGMLDLMYIVLTALRFSDPRIYVGKVRSRYERLAAQDQQIELQKIIYARGQFGLDRKRMMELLGIVHDPQKAIEEADEEQALLPQDDYERYLNDAARKDMNPESNENTPQSPAGGKDGG